MIDLDSPCILTQQCRTAAGYGQIGIDYKVYYHHRLVYVAYHKLSLADIDGKVVRHLCNNPPCVNPKHLEIGTHKDNIQDMIRAGRRKCTLPVLSLEQVKEIRCAWRTTSQRDLAKTYGVSEATISNVINRRRHYNY